jgi:ATP-dependent exoDNAse (exonuclease V) alpha subunit
MSSSQVLLVGSIVCTQSLPSRPLGTGKSVLLREIISFCGGAGSSELAITASTGIASVNIGGCTLHSWAGIGLGNETAKQFVGKFFGQPKFKPVLERWQEVKTLIIDESAFVSQTKRDWQPDLVFRFSIHA